MHFWRAGAIQLMIGAGIRSSLQSRYSRLGIGSGVVYHRISILSQVTSVSKVDRTAKANSCHSTYTVGHGSSLQGRVTVDVGYGVVISI